MSKYYRNGAANSDTDNLSVDGDSSQWPSRRPSTLPLLKPENRNSSVTETTSSPVSGLRTPIRSSDLLNHPSVYLREHGGNHLGGDGSTKKSKKSSTFSEFNVGTQNSIKQVSYRIRNLIKFTSNIKIFQIDYRIPDHNRHLEVRVDNRSIYIDPRSFKNFSPQISAFLLREYAAGYLFQKTLKSFLGHTKSVEPKIEDLNYDEVLEAVRAMCPTEYGLFATPVSG